MGGKRKLSKKFKLNENRGKSINFADIGGNAIALHHWLKGMDAPATLNPSLVADIRLFGYFILLVSPPLKVSSGAARTPHPLVPLNLRTTARKTGVSNNVRQMVLTVLVVYAFVRWHFSWAQSFSPITLCSSLPKKLIATPSGEYQGWTNLSVVSDVDV